MSKPVYVNGEKFVKWIRSICTNDTNFDAVLDTIVIQVVKSCRECAVENKNKKPDVAIAIMKKSYTETNAILHAILSNYPNFYLHMLENMAKKTMPDIAYYEALNIITMYELPDDLKKAIISFNWYEPGSGDRRNNNLSNAMRSIICTLLAYNKRTVDIVKLAQNYLLQTSSQNYSDSLDLARVFDDPELLAMDAVSLIGYVNKLFSCISVPYYHVDLNDGSYEVTDDTEAYFRFLYDIKQESNAYIFLSSYAYGHVGNFEVTYYEDLIKVSKIYENYELVVELASLSAEDDDILDYFLTEKALKRPDWEIEDILQDDLTVIASTCGYEQEKEILFNETIFVEVLAGPMLAVLEEYFDNRWA